ncbi:MAG TPA: Ig-like domain-containing protein, partial [Anaerolineae bacterium]
VGKALVAAKQAYLADTGVEVDGVFEKTILVSALFGLPMFSIDLPGTPSTPPALPPIVTSTTPVPTGLSNFNPGLATADISLTPALTTKTTTLTSSADLSTTYTATYLEGKDGSTARPGELFLPLESYNVNAPGGLADGVLRGVGFRSGSYTDMSGIMPLVSAPATEMNGIHQVFNSAIFYPPKPWTVNYFSTLADPADGTTRLMLTPAQFQSDGPNSLTGTLRRFTDMDFRLFYISNVNDTALAAPPSIAHVAADSGSGTVTFHVEVTDPIAGVQAVWVSYTGMNGSLHGQWQSLDLSRHLDIAGLWQGTLTLPAGTLTEDVRYMVQAVNWVGLVTLSTNFGAYYTPDVDPGQVTPAATTLTLVSPPATGVYATTTTLRASLTSNGAPLANQRVSFSLGARRYQAITDGNGQAVVSVVLLATPGEYNLQANFAGTADYGPARASTPFTLARQDTSLQMNLPSTSIASGDDLNLTVLLTDTNDRVIPERPVVIVFDGAGGGVAVGVEIVVTNHAGEAIIERIALPVASYTVKAYFSGQFTVGGETFAQEDAFYNPSSATGTLTITPGNIAPTAVADSAATDEDVAVTINVLSNDTDVDGNLDPASVSIARQPANGTVSVDANTGAITYQPAADFNGVDSFRYQVCDTGLDGNAATVADNLCATAVVTVAVIPLNDPPQVGPITAPIDPVLINTSITASADYSDADKLDTLSGVWDWGDGNTTAINLPGTSGTASASHTYTTAGVYTIQLTVTDADGESGTSIYEYVVVHDGSSGSVTGGGWINSPQGAYIDDPSLTGRANFGFNVNKNSSATTGQTEFNFGPADLNFHSTSHDSLTITGNTATFAGRGTINGAMAPDGMAYHFQIEITDRDGGNQSDRFSIQIWWVDNGSPLIVYNADQPLGGGNITIRR